MTVSNVVNGRLGEVSRETATRILDLVERLGYRPNATGRRLRSRRTNALGIVILDDRPRFLADPFTTSVVAGLGNAATDNGQSLVVQGLNSPAPSDAPLLSHLETDGIFVLASGPDSDRRALFDLVHRLNQPIIVFQDRIVGPDVCTIRQDDRGGASLLTRHLLERGARSFFLLLPAIEWPAMIEREIGVRSAVKGGGARITVVRCGDEGVDDTLAALATAVARHGLPDAVIGGNDRMAMAALRYFAQAKIAVPERVLVTGYNAFEFAQFAVPSLTTIRSPAYEMGRQGGALMLSRLREGKFRETDIVLPVEFILGDSG